MENQTYDDELEEYTYDEPYYESEYSYESDNPSQNPHLIQSDVISRDRSDRSHHTATYSDGNRHIMKISDIRLQSYEEVNPYDVHTRSTALMSPMEAERMFRANENTKPPNTLAGIRILKSDVRNANKRVHNLLVRLRLMLSVASGIPCSVVDDSLHESSGESKIGSPHASTKDLLTSACHVGHMLKENLGRFVSAMATTFKPGDCEKMYLGFLALHRLLHPISCDELYTTKLLHYALAYQLRESRNILEIYSTMDQKVIISRTLFISDPTTALSWNSLAQPIPVVPNVPTETVLSCLLRIYSIRRDLTSFLRLGWRHALPAVVAILEPSIALEKKQLSAIDHVATSFKNLLSVANRLLLCIFRTEIAETFPSSALSICQHIFEVGGNDALHIYLLNYLVLPNLIKILRGDHESIENELVHDKFSCADLINRYYNLDIWWPANGFESAPFNPINALIWLVWRLYTGATLLQTSTLELLTCEGFFSGGPNMDLSRVSNQKIRNILVRLQHKSDKFCMILLKQSHGRNPLQKPIEMTNYCLTSKEEMSWICRDILHEMDLNLKYLDNDMDENEVTSIYNFYVATSSAKALCDSLYDHIALDDRINAGSDKAIIGEDLLILNYDNIHNMKGQYESDSLSYDDLVKSLSLVNQYEDALLRNVSIVQRATANKQNPVIGDSPVFLDLIELILHDKSWHNISESTKNLKYEDVDLYDHHTATFRQKRKRTHHGFEIPSVVDVNDQDPIPIIHDIEHKSRSTLHAEMESALRFGAASQSIGVGTSIARSKHQKSRNIPSKLSNHDTMNRSVPFAHSQISRSRFTRSSIDPESNLLQQIESKLRKPMKNGKPNRFDLDKDFMDSMRGHNVIPTDEFLRRKQMIANRRRDHAREITRQESSYVSSSSGPRPFPDHLRDRLRPNALNTTQYYSSDNEENPNNPSDLANSIIRDYQNLFSINAMSDIQLAGKSDRDDMYPTFQMNETKRKDIPSPKPPDPVDGATSTYYAPTQALLNRCAQSKDLLEDLQSITDSNYRLHNRAFRPSGNSMVPSTGARIPRYLSDGDDIDEISSNGRYSSSGKLSRSSSVSGKHRRSRSNSVDSSISRPRSRSPSYHIRKEALPDEARGIFKKKSRPTTPNTLATGDAINRPFETREDVIDDDNIYDYTQYLSPVTHRSEFRHPSTEYVPVKGVSSSSSFLSRSTSNDANQRPNNQTNPILTRRRQDEYRNERFSENPDQMDTPSAQWKREANPVMCHSSDSNFSPIRHLDNQMPDRKEHFETDNSEQKVVRPISLSRKNEETEISDGSRTSIDELSREANVDNREGLSHAYEESNVSPNQVPVEDIKEEEDSSQTEYPLLPPSIKEKSQPKSKVPLIVNRKRDWQKDDLKSSLIDGITVLKVNLTTLSLLMLVY